MLLMGFTLNEITMLGLVLMVGIVIDDAIVVLENIFKVAEEKGLNMFEAAIEGTREIGLAVLATTLSLAIIFIPVALMSASSASSCPASATPPPSPSWCRSCQLYVDADALSRFLKVDPKGSGHDTKDSILYRAVATPYRIMLGWSDAPSVGHGLVAVLVTLSTGPLFMRIGKSFIPTSDQSEFEVTVRAQPARRSKELIRSCARSKRTSRPCRVRNLLTTIGRTSKASGPRLNHRRTVQPEDRKQHPGTVDGHGPRHHAQVQGDGHRRPIAALVSGGTDANSPSQCKDPSWPGWNRSQAPSPPNCAP